MHVNQINIEMLCIKIPLHLEEADSVSNVNVSDQFSKIIAFLIAQKSFFSKKTKPHQMTFFLV